MSEQFSLRCCGEEKGKTCENCAPQKKKGREEERRNGGNIPANSVMMKKQDSVSMALTNLAM
jgi:hypothetical protein